MDGWMNEWMGGRKGGCGADRSVLICERGGKALQCGCGDERTLYMTRAFRQIFGSHLDQVCFFDAHVTTVFSICPVSITMSTFFHTRFFQQCRLQLPIVGEKEQTLCGNVEATDVWNGRPVQRQCLVDRSQLECARMEKAAAGRPCAGTGSELSADSVKTTPASHFAHGRDAPPFVCYKIEVGAGHFFESVLQNIAIYIFRLAATRLCDTFRHTWRGVRSNAREI